MSVQVHEYLGLPLLKETQVRMSNWRRPLTSSQILYAAANAYAGLQLFHALDAKRKELRPCPPRPHHAELGLPIPYVAAPADAHLTATAEASTGQGPANACSAPAPVEAARAPASASSREPKAPSHPAPGPVMADARVAEAERRARAYLASNQTCLASPLPVLRTYFMWHANEDLDPESIARLLRDPPLRKSTVITYLLNAVVDQKLSYSRTRLKAQVLPFLHPTSLKGAYRSLARD